MKRHLVFTTYLIREQKIANEKKIFLRIHPGFNDALYHKIDMETKLGWLDDYEIDKTNETITFHYSGLGLDEFYTEMVKVLTFEEFLEDKIIREKKELIDSLEHTLWTSSKTDFISYSNIVKNEIRFLLIQLEKYAIAKEYNFIEQILREILSYLDTKFGENYDYLIADFPLKGRMHNEKEVTKTRESFISETRIEELKAIKSDSFDLVRLIRICEELNIAWQNESYLTVGILVRVILDHIPPIFGFNDFNTFASGYTGGRTVKQIALSLQESSRKIADRILHSPISRVVTLPNEIQVNNKREFDVLLEEIVRILK